MSTDDLQSSVPRPPDIWRAWEATAAYVARLTRQDASISLAWNTSGADAPWMAQFNWANNLERINRQDDPGAALLALWQQIEAQYQLFPDQAEARRAPRSYPEHLCLTGAEDKLLKRIILLADEPHAPAATLLITYQANAPREERLQARLLFHDAQAQTLRGKGPELLKALQDLYPRVAQHFHATITI